MQMSPGRDAVEYDYEIGYDENGLLLAVIYDVYIDVGVNETDGIGALFMGKNILYDFNQIIINFF